MRTLPTLRRELVTALAVVFAGALLVAATGVLLLVPRFEDTGRAVLYIGLLLAVDVAVFTLFGRYLIQRRILGPLERVIAGIEAIADGDYGRRLPPGKTREMARVADAVNRMAERMGAHRGELAANIRSLEETNRELTEARDELVRAEKMASVGRLAAGVAHEVGNPLGAVLGYLGVLRRSADEREQELIGSAEDEARRIDRIMHGLLDYARPREANTGPVAVNSVVERALELLTTQGRFDGVHTEWELGEALPPVIADAHQLQQVFVNLLINAVDATDGAEAPVVSVRTAATAVDESIPEPARREDDPPDVDYSHRRRFHRTPNIPRERVVAPGGEAVEIRVRDTGGGVPADVVDEIFEPFVTTKEPGQGTGLGLAVSARLIDATGGTIRVDNAGDGAEFTVVLPAAGPGERGTDRHGANVGADSLDIPVPSAHR